jgi:4'-phosphopantetheinyl transferase
VITVWPVDLAVDPDPFLPLLSGDERDRCQAMATVDLRRRYAVAHGSLRQRLASTLGTEEPASLVIAVGEHGKPFLADGALEFNLADSADVAVIAISDEGPVGVDVELVRPIEHERLARRFFSMLECAALDEAPDPEHAFFTIWTRKEAVVKATGRGISGGLSAFTVELAPHGHAAGGCWIEPLDAPPGFVAALAKVGGQRPTVAVAVPPA